MKLSEIEPVEKSLSSVMNLPSMRLTRAKATPEPRAARIAIDSRM